MLRLLIILLLLSSTAYAKPKVVTSFTILQDLTKEIAQDKIDLINIVDNNSEPHSYQPSPSDIKNIIEADLLIMNGLEFEGWIKKFQKIRKKPTLITTKNIKPLKFHSNNHNHNEFDPHAWQDLSNAKIYVRNIALALIKIDPKNATFYLTNLKNYTKKLEELDRSIKSQLNNLPKQNRKIIVSHNAFGYYAKAYDIKFISPLSSLDSQASAYIISKLITQIKQHNIKIIFLENFANQKLIKQIELETNAKAGQILYADSLPKNSNYLEMMQHNSKNIINSIKLIQ
ncbi:MAG: zinc ABC transporter substrate-binding protein [Rickettsiales bacterium]|nr:zinc ABC transporter substrate-binding protein [Rickettsiales bacterium]